MKVMYKITYPNGKIYVAQGLTRSARDCLEAWAHVVEHGCEGFVAKNERGPTRAAGRDAGSS